MIKLTLLDGRPLWINPNRITAVCKLSEQPITLIESGHAGVWWHVKEEPESIVSIMEWTGEVD